jgi:hypothetical protein
MNRSNAEIVREYGPFPGAERVNGVTYDGQHVWFASGDKLNAFDPSSGKMRALDRCRRACGNGLRRPAPVSDRRGSHPEDRSEDRPCARHDPGARRRRDSGLAWAEGTLWVGQYRNRKIHQSIPTQGRFFAPSSPTASSPASPGSTESSGTPPGKVTRAI